MKHKHGKAPYNALNMAYFGTLYSQDMLEAIYSHGKHGENDSVVSEKTTPRQQMSVRTSMEPCLLSSIMSKPCDEMRTGRRGYARVRGVWGMNEGMTPHSNCEQNKTSD